MSITSYFPHYSGARNDEKLLAVRMKYGMEGYGIYFAILERLRDTEDYTSVTDYNVIAFDLRVDASKIKSIVEDFGLFVFTESGEYFYSERFLNHMDYKDDISKKRAEAGRKGGLKKAENRQNKAKDNQSLSKNLANAKQLPSKPLAVNETKQNETKQNESKQDTITPEVILLLKKTYDPSWVDEAVRICVSKNKGVSYLEGILKNMKAEGGIRKPTGKSNKFHNFE